MFSKLQTKADTSCCTPSETRNKLLQNLTEIFSFYRGEDVGMGGEVLFKMHFK